MLHLTRIVSIVLLAAFWLTLTGCASVNTHHTQSANARTTQATPESQPKHDKVTTFLMFEGKAEEAINFYTSLFDDSEITSIERFGETVPAAEGAEGTVYQATFTLAGRPFRAFDSPAPHEFTFTPAISLFVTCETEAELERLYHAFMEGGQAAMPLGDYGFSLKFGWVIDRFGVSWQLNLPFE